VSLIAANDLLNAINTFSRPLTAIRFIPVSLIPPNHLFPAPLPSVSTSLNCINFCISEFAQMAFFTSFLFWGF
jgi:hypothetical protein